MKKCPRCKLPQEGIDSCEYCGLVFEKQDKKRKAKKAKPIQAQHAPVQQPKLVKDLTKRNPGTAAVLSFIIPGLGQIYNGQLIKGILIILVDGIAWLITIGSGDSGVSVFFSLVLVIILIASVVGAYRYANKMNQDIVLDSVRSTKKCPYCAELIKYEAIVCRYCGREFEKTEEEFGEKRILCSDGNCIGVIGPDGLCKECGKSI